ncbi:tripartite motif-containing protein 54-like isoform X2 [Styela clava]
MEALRMLSKGPGVDYEAEVERLLSCPICLEVYSKPVVILPCQHNLCRKCANDVFQNRGTPMGSGGRFRCPTCRYEVMLDRHGVYGLQRNLLVENIIDMYQSESKKPFRKVEVLMCEEHEEEKLNIFCVTCQKPTCSMCKVFGQHQECTVFPVEKVYKDHKSEVSGAIAMLVAGNDRLQTIISKTEELTVKTEENSKTVQSDVCASFDKLYAVLEQRKQAMLSKVKALTQEKTEILQSMLKQYGSQLESSSKLVEEALSLLEEPNAAQFLSVSRDLINRVTSTAKATDVRKPPADIHQMGMFAVDFSNHAKYLSRINFPARGEDEEIGSEDYETTSDQASCDSEVTSSAASTTHSGDVFQAKLLLPKADDAEEVVAAARVTRTDDDDVLSVTSRSDYTGSDRRESNVSFDDDKQLDQLDDEVKAIAEKYLSGRASRARSQASTKSDSSAEARRRSYSEEESLWKNW